MTKIRPRKCSGAAVFWFKWPSRSVRHNAIQGILVIVNYFCISNCDGCLDNCSSLRTEQKSFYALTRFYRDLNGYTQTVASHLVRAVSLKCTKLMRKTASLIYAELKQESGALQIHW